MDDLYYCNMINNAINERFREENFGCDSDVFVEERLGDGVIALNWHLYMDHFVTYNYVQRVANFIFVKFAGVEQILSPCGDFNRIMDKTPALINEKAVCTD